MIAAGILYGQLWKENNELRKQLGESEVDITTASVTVYSGNNVVRAQEAYEGLIKAGEETGATVVREKQRSYGKTTRLSNGMDVEWVDLRNFDESKPLPDPKSATVFIDLSIHPRALVDLINHCHGRFVFCFDAECANDEYLELTS
jgi:hypothetical protein